MKKNNQRRYKHLVLGMDKSYLVSSKCLSFWLTTYLLCLMDVFFNRQSVFLWGPTLLLFVSTFLLFLWGRRHTMASQGKPEKRLIQSCNFPFCYIEVIRLVILLIGSNPVYLDRKDTTDTIIYCTYPYFTSILIVRTGTEQHFTIKDHDLIFGV